MGQHTIGINDGNTHWQAIVDEKEDYHPGGSKTSRAMSRLSWEPLSQQTPVWNLLPSDTFSSLNKKVELANFDGHDLMG